MNRNLRKRLACLVAAVLAALAVSGPVHADLTGPGDPPPKGKGG